MLKSLENVIGKLRLSTFQVTLLAEERALLNRLCQNSWCTSTEETALWAGLMVKLWETFTFVETKHVTWKLFQKTHQVYHFVLTTLSLIFLVFLHLFLFLSPVQIIIILSSLTSGIPSPPRC